MKKILSLLLVLAMTLSLAACGPNESAADTQTAVSEESGQEDAQEETAEDAGGTEDAASEESAEEDASQTAYPVTVTDQAGREVVIEEEPQKLVSGYYISTSLLIALGLEDRLVGIEAKADTRPVYQLSAPELLELPSVGTAKEFDLEGCAALEPDLVILPLKLQDSADALEELGITALVVNPEDQELLNETIKLVGTASNTQEKAQSLLNFASEQEARLGEALADAETPSVYLAGNSALLSTAGDSMYQSDMIRMAGGVNAAAEITDAYWAEISYEQLLAWDPDVIVVNGEPKSDIPGASAADAIMNDPTYANLTAVQEGRVYGTPNAPFSWVDRPPGPNRIVGLRWLSALIYPDYIQVDVDDAVREFFSLFYHVELSDAQLEAIYNGQPMPAS